MSIIKIRCQAKTEDAFREIEVDTDKLIATCSCNGYEVGAFCSHIDAVLIAGERFMVPSDDHSKADRAMKSLEDRIATPADWKGAWRSAMRWRGLAKPVNRVDHTLVHGADYYDRPKICFTGAGPMSRKELLEHARVAGWQAVDNIVVGTKVLVAGDPTLNSNKLRVARKKGIPIISYEEYMSLTAEGELIDA